MKKFMTLFLFTAAVVLPSAYCDKMFDLWMKYHQRQLAYGSRVHMKKSTNTTSEAATNETLAKDVTIPTIADEAAADFDWAHLEAELNTTKHKLYNYVEEECPPWQFNDAGRCKFHCSVPARSASDNLECMNDELRQSTAVEDIDKMPCSPNEIERLLTSRSCEDVTQEPTTCRDDCINKPTTDHDVHDWVKFAKDDNDKRKRCSAVCYWEYTTGYFSCYCKCMMCKVKENVNQDTTGESSIDYCEKSCYNLVFCGNDNENPVECDPQTGGGGGGGGLAFNNSG